MSVRLARTALLCCLLLWLLPAQAISSLGLQIGQWTFSDYRGQQLEMQLELTASGFRLIADAKHVSLPPPLGDINQLKLHCDNVRYTNRTWQCSKGQLDFQHPQLGKQQLSFTFSATSEQQHYQLSVEGLRLAQGRLNFQLDYQDAAWKFAFDAKAIKLESLSDSIAMLPPEQQNVIMAWQYQGSLSLEGELRGHDQLLKEFDVIWDLTELGFSNQSASQVAEQLVVSGRVKVKRQDQTWQWHADVDANSGQAYFEPVFLDLTQHAVSLDAKGKLSADLKELEVYDSEFIQDGVITANAELSLVDSELVSLSMTTQSAAMETLYPNWLQPFALGTAAARLTTSGDVSLNVDWKDENYQLALNLDNVSLKDEEGRFELTSLNGQLGWSTTDKVMKSNLSWTQAQLFAISLGEAEVEARSSNNGLALDEALDLPILDGQLLLSAFQLVQEDDGVDWSFEGLLTPISMESLTGALGWPILHGKLSGVIPKVSYHDQQLKIAGALQVKVFDGTTVIRDLRMTSPFGSLPQLYANIDIDNIELALLTQAFDFGRISGRLEGYVRELRLSNWEPVQFNARLATPEQNPGKRRISQKAVDNLTQIGGGASGMLQRGFLQFFEDFSYQKLGLACQLRNEVCEMSGIEEAEQGYYIVKGGGGLPPWINVVGYTRRVDWSDLVARLLAVRESAGPVVQ